MRSWLTAIFLHIALLSCLIAWPQFGKMQSLPKDSGGISAFWAGPKVQVSSQASNKQMQIVKPASAKDSDQTGNRNINGVNQAVSKKLAPKNIQVLLNVIDRDIQEHLVYPDLAQSHVEQGSVRLAFDVRPDGQINNIVVGKSSGDQDLDRAAVRAVEESSPVSMPVHLSQSIHLSLPVDFSLE